MITLPPNTGSWPVPVGFFTEKSSGTPPSGYESLERVLADAVAQASSGKGKARHAVEGEPFEKQQICEIARRLKGHPAASVLFQVVKKVYESGRLDKDAAIAELRGAVNYLGAALIVMEEL